MVIGSKYSVCWQRVIVQEDTGDYLQHDDHVRYASKLRSQEIRERGAVDIHTLIITIVIIIINK